jgi:trk system potassium uptake protein TrkA
MKVIIVGGGKTLYFLSKSFAEKGYEVVVVNRDHDECVQMARQLKALVIEGDGGDPQILREAGALGADAVIAITPNDQDNLVICQVAALQCGVPRILAMANDPENAEVFQKLGIPAFSTTQIIGNLIQERASLDEVMNLLPIGEGKVNVTEIVLTPESPVAGKHLKDIMLPDNALVAVVIRNGQAIVPRGDNQLLQGDRVILITLPENHGTVLKSFTGEQQ